MKTRIGLFLVLAAGIAFAAQNVSTVKTVALANVATEPTSLTEGMPVVFPNNQTLSLRRMVVTAKQADDGGAEAQDLTAVSFRAWKYTPQGNEPDGGTLYRWSRMPELDMTYVTDAGSPYVTNNNALTISTAIPIMGNGGRITYTAHDPVLADAGTAKIDLVIEGNYQ